jgi:hypothetical protein
MSIMTICGWWLGMGLLTVFFNYSCSRVSNG